MRAISLNQPYASLIALGSKRIETRHWAAPKALIGQRIAIYATKGRIKDEDGRQWTREQERELLAAEPFLSHLSTTCANAAAANRWLFATAVQEALPRGVVVATAILERCRLMDDAWIDELQARRPDEIAFGFYDAGRYGWVLRDLIRTEPVSLDGLRGSRQSIFEVPDDLIAPAMRLPTPSEVVPA